MQTPWELYFTVSGEQAMLPFVPAVEVMEYVFSVKAAVQVLSTSIIIDIVLSAPEQSPFHPVNVEDSDAMAVTITFRPCQ